MENLKEKNWFKINSTCSNYFEVSDYKKIKNIVELAESKNLKIFILGEGSNVLLNEHLDNYFVIKFINKNYKIIDNLIEVDAGLNFNYLIDISLKNNLIGLENFSLIPGNIGGITFMNIHYKGYYISDYIDYIDVFKISEKKYFRLNSIKLNYSYTENIFKETNDYIIYRVGFKLKLDKYNIKDSIKIREHIISLRSLKYPTSNTCGCFFYNIETLSGINKSIGYQIEKLNIEKEYIFKNVTLYSNHKNMFITNNKVSSDEILCLAKFISKKINDKLNYKPKVECRLIGFDETKISELL